MSSEGAAFVSGIGVGALIVVLLSLVIPQYTLTYKKGQVDALTGKVQYHLVDKPDGTKVWERK